MKRIRIHDTPLAEVQALVATALSRGEIVVYPTETCYGVGVDAQNSEAVQKLLAFKGDRGNKAISIAVADKSMASRFVQINELAENIYSTLLPGPVTVISQDLGKVARPLVSTQGTLGVRIPNYAFTLDLIKNFGSPITATSANTSGQKPPYSYDDWTKYTAPKKQEMITYFLDAGQLPHRPPSTVVDTTLNEPEVIRQGDIIIPSKSSTTVKSMSVEETQAVAQHIIESNKKALVQKPLIIALQGEMGAGKTHFVQGLAKALGILENVPSPTYTLMREYAFTKGKLYHIDTWRMHSAADLDDLGFADLLKPGNIIAVEWVQKVKETVARAKAQIVWVEIVVISENERLIRYSSRIG